MQRRTVHPDPRQLSLFQEETVTVKWAADYLKVSVMSVLRYRDNGFIKGYQMCERGSWRLIKASILEYEATLRSRFSLSKPSVITPGGAGTEACAMSFINNNGRAECSKHSDRPNQQALRRCSVAIQKSTRFAFLFLAFTLTACGSMAPVVHAAPAPPPFQPLTCVGTATAPGGMICDDGDAQHSDHWSWAVAMRPDGHGTFQASTETATKGQPGTWQITLSFPQVVNIDEVHGTVNVISWCANNGLNMTWQGAQPPGTVLEQLVSAKWGTITGQTMFLSVRGNFAHPAPVSQLYLYVNNDLGACSTVSWALNGSF